MQVCEGEGVVPDSLTTNLHPLYIQFDCSFMNKLSKSEGDGLKNLLSGRVEICQNTQGELETFDTEMMRFIVNLLTIDRKGRGA